MGAAELCSRLKPSVPLALELAMSEQLWVLLEIPGDALGKENHLLHGQSWKRCHNSEHPIEETYWKRVFVNNNSFCLWSSCS